MKKNKGTVLSRGYVWPLNTSLDSKNDFIESKNAEVRTYKLRKSTFFEITIWFTEIIFDSLNTYFYLVTFLVPLEKPSKTGLIFGILSSDFFGVPSWPHWGFKLQNRPFTVAVL